ncbi:MAG: galactokinase [Rikenellaceae bacterium]
MKSIIEKKFTEVFEYGFEQTFASPGRINIIGEHTDYNMGFVLPAAIDKCIYGSFAKKTNGSIRIYSYNYQEFCEFKVSDIEAPKQQWAKYVYGITQEILKGIKSRDEFSKISFDCVFGGDIPLGAGLSSSAALENLFSFALNEIYHLGLIKEELAKIGQACEHNYVGVKCGIMDQFASMMGEESKVIKLDCRNLDYSYFPFIQENMKIILFDTKVKHSLASSEYNVRRTECEQGVEKMKKFYPKITSLRDVTIDQIDKHRELLSGKEYDRCSYVVEENMRLFKACEALEKNDLKTFGTQIYRSHSGLQHKYEVSCIELDTLVYATKNVDGCYGARMMGGGFGGCTINFIRPDIEEVFINKITKTFYNKLGKHPEVIGIQIGKGTHKL